MKTIEEVWLYVDALAPAGDALGTAVDVARRSGAALTLIGAIGRSEDRIFETSFGERILQLVRKDRESRMRALEANARTALPSGRIRSILIEGDVPWHSVAARAGAQAPDLLVVAARGGIGTGFDPVSQHLFRKCAVPVWSVYPGKGGFPPRALAAVDPGRAKSDERRLALRVLEVARRIAGAGPLELHVAAWTVPGEVLLPPSVGDAGTHAYVDSVRENARRELEELLVEAEVGAAAEVHLPRGEPASAIPALAERVDADLVLLGSAGRLLIGSTAEGIISHLARSALVVKPPGFVSPVRPSKHESATLVSARG